jgi:UDPglucose--hexose-1-phosphate uridylyltransferase
VVPDAREPERDARPELFTVLRASGAHEVIVNTPDPVVSLAQVDAEQAALAVEGWRRRMRHHVEAGASYVHLHVNERAEGGASRPTPTRSSPRWTSCPPTSPGSASATAPTPPAPWARTSCRTSSRRRSAAAGAWSRWTTRPSCSRPFASRVPYQLMVVPRRPAMAFEAEGQGGARLLHEALRRLAARFGAPPPLTMWVRTAPRGADRFGWRIDVLPRLVRSRGSSSGRACT